MLTEEESECLVQIFEHNEFRHLLHLELRLKRGSDDEGRQWLSKKVLLSKQANSKLEEEKALLMER